jgi:hypothetical protein
VVSIILWSRVQVPAGPPNQKTNPSSGWSFFAYSRVFARVRAGSCGLRGFPRAPGFGRLHSLLAILLSGLAPREGPKSTSAPNGRVTNQQLIRGPFKRLIRGIGRRWEQRCRAGEREIPSGCQLAGRLLLQLLTKKFKPQRTAVLPKLLSAFSEGAPKGKTVVARCITAPPGRFQRQTRLPSTMRQGPAITSFSGATTTSFVGATTTSFAGSATGLRTSTAPSRPTHPACRTPSAHSTATALVAAAVMSTAAVRDTTRLFIFVLQSIEWLETNVHRFHQRCLPEGVAGRVQSGE